MKTIYAILLTLLTFPRFALAQCPDDWIKAKKFSSTFGAFVMGNPVALDADGNLFQAYNYSGNVTIGDSVYHAAYDKDSAAFYEKQGTYKAMTLEEIEEYVKINRHVPGIKSAGEYMKTGSMDLGEINIKLLEKIEELTLYTIAQDKQLQTQQELLKLQQAQLDELNKKIALLLLQD